MTAHDDTERLHRVLTALASASGGRSGMKLVLPEIASVFDSTEVVIRVDDETKYSYGKADVPVIDRGAGRVEVGDLYGLVTPLLEDGYLLVARRSPDFDDADLERLAACASAVDLFERMWRARDSERLAAERGHRQAVENVRLLDSLMERQRLLERLTRLQRSISHRAPLQEVLDAVCHGARELIGDEVVGVRLIDPEDPGVIEIKASVGVPEHVLDKVSRAPVGVGAGGRAASENRLVIVYEYDRSENAITALKEDGLQSAMAAPVHEHGEPVGSLVVATYRKGRRYSQVEQEVLLAFAEHVSIALSDSKTVEALREAQRVKEMFLAMVSHELKTPLTAIMGTLRTFKRHDAVLHGELRESMLDSAIVRGEQLAHLINRLLIGARAELANVVQDIDLGELIHSGLKGFEEMGVVIVDAIPSMTVRADASSIQGALGILLENAIAHSPPGSQIHIRTRTDDDELSIEVINQGELPDGLDSKALFQPFQRGPDARSSGVGLGLYIALRLVQASGGSIDVRTDEGFIIFNLRVPLKVVQPTPDSSPL